MGEVDLVVFDLAGTTVKDGGQVPAAFVAALAERGIRVSSEQLTRVRGSSKRQAIDDLIPAGAARAAEADAAYASFRRHLARAYQTSLEPIDGAGRVFAELRRHGVRIALTTGFDRDITSLLLSGLGWHAGVVDAVVCSDEVASGRPAPFLIFHAMEATGAAAVQRVAAVGDTTLDLAAGWNAGVRWNVGVLSGAHDRPLLETAPHTHLIPSIADLPAILFPV